MDKMSEFCIKTSSAVPLYEQIKREIKLWILSEKLLPNDRLIPIREFAKQLNVNQNTIVKVYYQLYMEGFVYSKPGQGYFVNQRDKKDSSKSEKLFLELTEEYIQTATDLGFKTECIVKCIKSFSNDRKKSNLKRLE